MIHTTIHQSIEDLNDMNLKENNHGNKLALKKIKRGRVLIQIDTGKPNLTD